MISKVITRQVSPRWDWGTSFPDTFRGPALQGHPAQAPEFSFSNAVDPLSLINCSSLSAVLVLLHLPHLKSEAIETQGEERWLGPPQREVCGCSTTANSPPCCCSLR